mgnify:CR=1 FL=1
MAMRMAQNSPSSPWPPSNPRAKVIRTREGQKQIPISDTAIGRVLDFLDETNLAENTLVIWYSDNGAFLLDERRGLGYASNAPLRDGGVTLYEGGIRVPAIVRWPGRIEPSSICSEPVISMDLTAMCLAAAGADPPGDRKLDGIDPTEVLAGEAPSRHDNLFWQWKQGRQGTWLAVRSGDLKLVRPGTEAAWELYNLRDDIGEKNDLAAEHPDRVAELKSKIETWLATVVEN